MKPKRVTVWLVRVKHLRHRHGWSIYAYESERRARHGAHAFSTYLAYYRVCEPVAVKVVWVERGKK